MPRLWIGITNIVGGVWRNLDDGKIPAFFNWASGEPKNVTYPLSAYMHGDGLWHTTHLYDSGYFLCSVPGSGETSSEKSGNAP